MNARLSKETGVKCAAMRARLFDRGVYDELLAMRSVGQITKFLKTRSRYSDALGHVDEDDAHRGILERLFKRSLFYDYERLSKFLTGGYRNVVKALFSKYEIDDLKLIIGSIHSNGGWRPALDDLAYMKSYGGFPIQPLLRAATMEELAAGLSGARYHEAIMQGASGGNHDLIRIDRALNILNYRAIAGAVKKSLKGANRTGMERLIGTRCVIDNIMSIYRLKRLYRFRTEDIMAFLLPCEYEIGRKKLIELADCGDTGELIDMIAETKYGPLFPKDRADEWEALHADCFCRLHGENLRYGSAGESAAVSYLHLKEAEIKNVINIIEGVRYSMDANDIVRLLAGYGLDSKAGRKCLESLAPLPV